MCYTYVLLSSQDREWYTGAASDLKTRLRRPLRLIYYEACLEAADAYRRERHLKTGRGKRYLRQRLKTRRTQFSREKLERH
jgi:putative endonuclease